MTSNHDLSDRLTSEADQFYARGGTDLDMRQVLDRAGEIRRGRRMRATMLMAACVLAIAVPTALVASHRDTHPAPTPAHTVRIDRSPLTLDGLETGSEPRGGYVRDSALHSDGFDYTLDGERIAGFARFSGGLVVAVQNAAGDLRARRIGAAQTWPLAGGFTVSKGGHVVAFVQPDGTPVVLQSGETAYELPRIPRGSGFDAVAVAGEDCQETATNPGCTVWVASSGRTPESWVSTSHGSADLASTRLLRLADVVEGRWVAGITKVADDGSCSEVEAIDTATALWATCEHRFLAFSPDGTHLLASSAYADGMGDSELAILDSDTGKTVLDLRTADQAVLTQLVWEDASHVLADLYQDGRWAVVRIGLDGHREYAVPPVPGNDSDGSPFVLPSS
jgi:hypothetical protein